MSKDWNEEWDMEQAEVAEMIASFEAMKNCEHEWGPLPEEERDLFSEDTDAELCPKCGAVQVTVTENEFNVFREALEDSRVGED